MASSKQQTKTKPRPAQRPGQGRGPAQGQRTGQAQRGQAQRGGQTRKARDRARARELAEQQGAAAEPEQAGPPLWLPLTTLVLSLAGLGVSIYMTIEHFTNNATLACSINSVTNCIAVTTSPESMVFGVIPVAVLGLAFFVPMVALSTPWAWRTRWHGREIALLRLASLVVGMGFVVYLIYVELIQVGYICLECTSVHVITFVLFALTVTAAAIWGLPEGSSSKQRRHPVR